MMVPPKTIVYGGSTQRPHSGVPQTAATTGFRRGVLAHADWPFSGRASQWLGSVGRMRTRSVLPAALCALLAGLVGCAPHAEPDWPTAEAAAQKFERVASSQSGFLGSASVRSDHHELPPPNESEVALSYTEAVLVEGVTLACFGEGAADIGFNLRVGSSWLGGDSARIECDGAAREINFDEPFADVNGVSISGARADGAGGMLVAVISGVGSPGQPAF